MTDVLDRAADYIEENGWWDGNQPEHRGNRLCVVMAIGKVARERLSVFARDEYERFGRFIGVGSGYGVTFWNDTPDRTQDEVVNALRAAAKGEVPS